MWVGNECYGKCYGIGLWINSVEEELNYAENQTDAPVLLYRPTKHIHHSVIRI